MSPTVGISRLVVLWFISAQGKNLGAFIDWTLASSCANTLVLSVVLPTLSCAESVPSVRSSLKMWPQLLSALAYLSRIDYCNSFLAGITSEQIAQLQKVQDNAAQLIFRQKHSEHITLLLKALHCLLIKWPIEYKLATFTFCYFDSKLPLYISHCLSPYTPCRSLLILFWQTTIHPACTFEKCQC